MRTQLSSGLLHLLAAAHAARPSQSSNTPEVQLRQEAASQRDVVVLGGVREHYFNITHQTLEACRFAAVDAAATHLLKVGWLWVGRG